MSTQTESTKAAATVTPAADTKAAPKAASRAKTPRTAKGKGTAKAKSQTAGKTAPKAAEPKMVSALGTEDKGSPYSIFKGEGSNEAFSAYTLAAFVVAGLATMSAAGTFTRKDKGGYIGLWRSLVGKRAAGYWKTGGLIDDKGLTPAGQVKAQTRLNGETAYKTTKEAVSLLLTAMRADKPSKVTVETSKGKVTVPMGARHATKA